MNEHEVSLDMLWDGPPVIRHEIEARTSSSLVARILLESCGRVRRCAELLAGGSTMPELAPTPTELRLLLDLAQATQFPRPLRRAILDWMELVCAGFTDPGAGLSDVLAATKTLSDLLLTQVAPPVSDLESLLRG